MDKIQTLSEVLSLLRRRFFLWASVIAIGVLISLIYALSLPRSYETSATIQIEQPSIHAGEDTRGSLNADMLQKLQIVEQRVMARDNLLTIINKFGLYVTAPGLTEVQKVDLLRDAARVRHVTNPELRWRQDISPSALLVTVRMSDPVLAANVANELVNNVLEQESRRRTERVHDTLEFFDGEEHRIEALIDLLEDQIADYKRQHDVLLPGGVEALRLRLADLQQIELEVQRQILALHDRSTGGESTIGAQRVRRLEEESDLYNIEISELEAAIAQTPGVEQKHNKLRRKLDKLEDQYQAITVAKAEAEMNQMLETNRQSNSFAVLEKALPPKWPIAPSRKRILFIGVLLSTMVALSLVFLIEMRSPVIRTRRQLEQQLNLRVVSTIPVLTTARQRRRQYLRRTLQLGSFASVFAALAALILKFGR